MFHDVKASKLVCFYSFMFFYRRYRLVKCLYTYYTISIVPSFFHLEKLISISSQEVVCLNDTAVLLCTSEGIPFLNWDIRTARHKSSRSFSFNTGNPVGHSEKYTLASSPIVFYVTFNNGSFISATLTVRNPTNFNGSTVICNGGMFILNIPTLASKLNIIIVLSHYISILYIRDTQASSVVLVYD